MEVSAYHQDYVVVHPVLLEMFASMLFVFFHALMEELVLDHISVCAQKVLRVPGVSCQQVAEEDFHMDNRGHCI
ncbi:hypothetical protein X975_18129, partial [Stegodyphus mimosarum]